MERYSKFNLFDLMAKYFGKNMTIEETVTILKGKKRQWKRVWVISSNIQTNDFPKYNSVASNKKRGRTCCFSKRSDWGNIAKAYASGLIRNAMVHLLFSLALKPGNINFLKFGNINIYSGIPTINAFLAKTNKTQVSSIY